MAERGEVLTAKRHLRGARLIEAIEIRARELGLTQAALATKHLRISPDLWEAVKEGEVPIDSLHRRVLGNIARLLGRAEVTVLQLADSITWRSFMPFATGTAVDRLVHIGRKIRQDPRWSGFAPAAHEWDTLAQKEHPVVVLAAYLYENTAETKLFPLVDLEPTAPHPGPSRRAKKAAAEPRKRTASRSRSEAGVEKKRAAAKRAAQKTHSSRSVPNRRAPGR